MELQIMPQAMTVCRVASEAELRLDGDLVFIGKTDEEYSLVCPTDCVPEDTVEREDGWRCFRIRGVLDFSLIGILSKLSAVLAEQKIGIFAVSTYNTDYILVKQENFDKALVALANSEYIIK